MKEALQSPQVLAAIITGIVAVSLAVLPKMFDNQLAPTPTPIVITQTPLPPTATDIPTEAPLLPTATDIPTETSIIPTATDIPTQSPIIPTATDIPPTHLPANTLLLYDDVSFTIYNQSSSARSFSDLHFRSSNGRWDASQWGLSLTNSLPANTCLRMRDSASGQRQPPAICGSLHGLQLVSGTALFWFNTNEFEVLQGDTVIATCSTTDIECPIFVP